MYRRFSLPGFLFEEDTTGAAAPAVEPVAEPDPTVVTTPVAPPAGDGPWAKDLATFFEDETIRGNVDSFLRSKIQPHVTQIEQQHAPARELWTDLQGDDSLSTYVGVANQLYGEDAAKQIAEILAKQFGEEEETPAAETPAEAPLHPRLQALLDKEDEERENQEYDAELARVKALDPRIGSTIDDEDFAPFVIGAEGDFDTALARFQVWHAKVYPQGAPEVVPPVIPPPAVLGGDTGGGATPPLATKYESLDSALDAAMTDLRAARVAPTTV